MKSEKDWLVTLLLCIFFGGIGVHRFYAGKIGTGILQLITLGGCGIWSLIDFVMISLDKYKDANGQELMEYNQCIGYGLILLSAVVTILCIIF